MVAAWAEWAECPAWGCEVPHASGGGAPPSRSVILSRRARASAASRARNDSTISVHSGPPSAVAGGRVTSIRNRARIPSAVTIRGGGLDWGFTRAARGGRPPSSITFRDPFSPSSLEPPEQTPKLRLPRPARRGGETGEG